MWGQPPSAVLRAQLEAFRCRQQSLAFTRALTIRPRSARILKAVRNGQLVVCPKTVGLWRSWERASMAWKKSSVRSRPGPPFLQYARRLRPSEQTQQKILYRLRRTTRGSPGRAPTRTDDFNPRARTLDLSLTKSGLTPWPTRDCANAS